MRRHATLSCRFESLFWPSTPRMTLWVYFVCPSTREDKARTSKQLIMTLRETVDCGWWGPAIWRIPPEPKHSAADNIAGRTLVLVRIVGLALADQAGQQLFQPHCVQGWLGLGQGDKRCADGKQLWPDATEAAGQADVIGGWRVGELWEEANAKMWFRMIVCLCTDRARFDFTRTAQVWFRDGNRQSFIKFWIEIVYNFSCL